MKKLRVIFNICFCLAVLIVSCKKNVKQFKVKLYNSESKSTKSGHGFAAAGLNGVIPLGTGINSATGELAAANIAENGPEDIITDTAGGDQGEGFFVTRITTLSALQKSLDMSFDATGSIGPVDIGGKADFFNSTNISSTSDYFIVKVKARSYSKYLKDPKISEEALNRSQQDGIKFFKFAGDSFVYEQIYGGELYIFFAADSYTKTEKSANSQSLDAGVSVFSASGDRKEMREALYKVTHLKISIIRSGSRGFTITDSVNVDQLINMAGRFHEEARKYPTLIAVHTKTLDKLKGYPEVDQVNLLKQKYYLNDIVNKIDQIRDVQSNLLYIAGAQNGVFTDSLKSAARVLSVQLKDRTTTLQRCKTSCEYSFDISDCRECPELYLPVPEFLYNLPDSLH